MTTQILRTIDRWRFETPLALALGASAGFAALTAPARLMADVPVAGDMGTAGRAIVAALLAAVSAGAGYIAMRRPAKVAARPAEPAEPAVEEEERPSGMPAERLARFRRADAHPDAPPREPIIASRDLGEPFMDVGGFAPPDAAAEPEAAWWPETAIPDGEYVELAEEATLQPIDVAEPAFADGATLDAVKEAPASAPEVPTAPRGTASIGAMVDRLSAGLERRASVPPRDPTPALRDALAELNRLAGRRN